MGFPEREASEDGQRCQQSNKGPERPALGPSLDQGHRHEKNTRGNEDGANDVKAATATTRFGQDAHGSQTGDDADRDVEQEDRPPAEIVQIRLNDQSAEQRPESHRDTGHGAVHAERLAALSRRKRDLNDGQDGRVHDAGHRPLRHPPADQGLRTSRRAAQGRRHGEPDQADEKETFVPIAIGQASRGDQQQSIRQGVAADDPFDR